MSLVMIGCFYRVWAGRVSPCDMGASIGARIGARSAAGMVGLAAHEDFVLHCERLGAFMHAVIMAVLITTAMTGTAIAQTEAACSTAGNAPLPDPTAVTMAATVPTASGNIVSLYRCTTNQSSIKCYFVYTRKQKGSADYNLPPTFLDKTKLIDNFHESHKADRGYFCSGRNQARAVSTINLAEGESIWMVIGFAEGALDINQGRVFYPNDAGGGTIEVVGPVLKPL